MTQAALNLILVGAPGSGKGTQAALLIERRGLTQISTGDILRQAVKEGTELGMQAKRFMDAGELVPDGLIVGLIRERLAKGGLERGFVLDGFPRTLAQAEALSRMLSESKTSIHRVLVIDVPEEAIVERIVGRRSCTSCGNVHHVKFSPPKKDGICDRCGNALVQRADDQEDKVRVRLRAFAGQTAEVIPYYERQGLVARIDGQQAPDAVYKGIERVLGPAAAS